MKMGHGVGGESSGEVRMKELETDKAVLILLSLIVVQILCSGLSALTGTPQQAIGHLTAVVIPLSVALLGLRKFKYWAWLVAVIVVFFNLTGLLSIIPAWSEHIAYYQRHDVSRIRMAYSLVISHVINLVIFVLLVVERGYFDE